MGLIVLTERMWGFSVWKSSMPVPCSGWVHQTASVPVVFCSYHMTLGSLASSNKPKDSHVFSLLLCVALKLERTKIKPWLYHLQLYDLGQVSWPLWPPVSLFQNDANESPTPSDVRTKWNQVLERCLALVQVHGRCLKGGCCCRLSMPTLRCMRSHTHPTLILAGYKSYWSEL